MSVALIPRFEDTGEIVRFDFRVNRIIYDHGGGKAA
jgi:hypothetical protein